MDSSIKEQFERDGFYRAERVFSTAEMDKLERHFDAIVDQLRDNGEAVNARWKGSAVDQIDQGQVTELYHTHNVQKFSAAWMQAWLHPRFLSVAREILGRDIILHHSKLFQKPAEKGAPFPIHQDWSYFPMQKDTMIAGVVHVSDASEEMGCLRVYPGTHRLGRMEESDGKNPSKTLSDYPLEKAVPVECRRGDVLFFHYFTLHGSMSNRSARIRKTVLAQLHSGDDRMDECHHHPNEQLTLSGFNRTMKRSLAAKTTGER
ncbi:MAG: phytanoyl-CoA dioxygenase family protein [Opitutaceae bacterium]